MFSKQRPATVQAPCQRRNIHVAEGVANGARGIYVSAQRRLAPAARQTADGQAIIASPTHDATQAARGEVGALGNVLVPAVLGKRFLAVEAERLDHRTVVDRKENRILVSGIGVLVQRPRGQREDVALAPVVRLAFDDGTAPSLRDAK